MNSSAEIRFRFMWKTPVQGCKIVRAWSRDSVRRDRQDNNPALHHRKGGSVDSEAVPFQTLARPIRLHHARSLRAERLPTSRLMSMADPDGFDLVDRGPSHRVALRFGFGHPDRP